MCEFLRHGDPKSSRPRYQPELLHHSPVNVIDGCDNLTLTMATPGRFEPIVIAGLEPGNPSFRKKMDARVEARA